MASIYEVPPAGTSFMPRRIDSVHTRQIYPRTPSAGSDFQSGRTIQFAWKATPTDMCLLNECRLVAKLKVTDGDGSTAVAESLRFQSDPLAALFSQARLSINGIVVSSCGANYPALSNIHARTHTTVEGQQTIGTEGLIGFQKDMYRVAGVVTAAAFGAAASSGVATGTAPAFDLASANLFGFKRNARTRNPKLEILHIGETEIEISAPIPLDVFRLSKALGQNMELILELTVAENFMREAFYSQDVPSEVATNKMNLVANAAKATGLDLYVKGDHSTAYELGTAATDGIDIALMTGASGKLDNAVAFTSAATGITGLKMSVQSLFLSAVHVRARAPIPRPLTTQYNWEACTLLTRTLTTTQSFTEVFQIPLSTTRIAIAARIATPSLNVDSEVYDGLTVAQTLSVQRGSALMPSPAYHVNPGALQVGRAMSDYNRIVGATIRNGLGGKDLFEWCAEPVFMFSSHTEESASSITVRLTTSASAVNGVNLNKYELMVFCWHQRVLEHRVSEDGQPLSTVVDELIQ